MAILRVMLHGVEEEGCGKNKSCPHRRDRIGWGKDGRGRRSGLANGPCVTGLFCPAAFSVRQALFLSVAVRDTITT